MSKKRIAINGFGRIGRAAFKIILERDDSEVVAINDLTDKATLAHLLKYDSVYRQFEPEVGSDEDHIIVDGHKFLVLSEREPKQLPWKDLEVDVVLECTGVFLTSEASQAHIDAGAKRVIISAPAKDDVTMTVVKGVSDDISSDDRILSNASCTTNCIAPVMYVISKAFGVEKAMMTTIHAYTADQSLVDGPHKDLRRARAAAQNIIPTTTGAAIATGKVIPAVQGLFDGLAIRVPVITGSLSDITFVTEAKVTIEEINNALQTAAENEYQGIIEVTDKPIASAIVDLSLTNVVGGNLVKVIAWYDNEWGYSNRLVDMACK